MDSKSTYGTLSPRTEKALFGIGTSSPSSTDDVGDPEDEQSIMSPNDELTNQVRLAGGQGEDETVASVSDAGNPQLLDDKGFEWFNQQPENILPSTGPSNPQPRPGPLLVPSCGGYGPNSYQDLEALPDILRTEMPEDPNSENWDSDHSYGPTPDLNSKNRVPVQIDVRPPIPNFFWGDIGDSNYQPVEPHTYDHNPPVEPHFDSGPISSHNPSSLNESANPDQGRHFTTSGPRYQPGEYHDREQATDHGWILGSGQRHPRQQNLSQGHRNPSPSKPSAGCQAISSQPWTHTKDSMGEKEEFRYIYDKDGRLLANGGYGKDAIEIYLCNHRLYRERHNIKDCGLTLWIQRAPRNADYRGGAAGRLCLYEDCGVNTDRSINAGDVRIAFDEMTALSQGHDPQINAGYVHLKCLEKYMPKLRQMFAKLNFKVEGRAPPIGDPLQRNATIFSTMQEIVYVEEHLEQCRKECRKDSKARPAGKTSEPGSLSAGIEKHLQGQYKEVRDVQKKLLELEGWYDLKTILDERYAQAGRPAQTASPFPSQQPRNSQNDTRFDAEEHQPGTNQEDDDNGEPTEDPYNYGREESPVRQGKWPDPRIHPKSPVPDLRKERSHHSQPKQSGKIPPSKDKRSPKKDKRKKMRPPFKGEGKIKKRMFIDENGNEIWEEFEDPWSPLESGGEHEPKKRTRVPRKKKEQAEGSTAGGQDVGQNNDKRQRVDLNDGYEDEDEGDHRGKKRRR